jgi:hypothetical protein
MPRHFVFETAAREAAKLHWGDRFDRVEITLLKRHAEQISGTQEAYDNSPAVAEQPQCAQHSIRDLEDVSGLIALPEYGPTGRKPFDWLPMK